MESWGKARAEYLRYALETGRTLHEYVLARLQEAEEVTDFRRRQRLGISRERYVADAAAALGLTRTRVNNMIQVAMLVKILGEGIDLAGCTFGRLRALGALVARRAMPGRGWDPILREAGASTSAVEEWALRPRVSPAEARDLFRRAVRDRMRLGDIYAAVRALLVKAGHEVPDRTGRGRAAGPTRPTEPVGPARPTGQAIPPRPVGDVRDCRDQGDYGPSVDESARIVEDARGFCHNYHHADASGHDRPDILRVARMGTPNDLADLVARVVLESRDPEATRAALEHKLRSLRVPIRF